jgi:hypothetical protein
MKALSRRKALSSVLLCCNAALTLVMPCATGIHPLPVASRLVPAPGVHSPNSPFAPLPQRTDVLPWSC